MFFFVAIILMTNKVALISPLEHIEAVISSRITVLGCILINIARQLPAGFLSKASSK